MNKKRKKGSQKPITFDRCYEQKNSTIFRYKKTNLCNKRTRAPFEDMFMHADRKYLHVDWE